MDRHKHGFRVVRWVLLLTLFGVMILFLLFVGFRWMVRVEPGRPSEAAYHDVRARKERLSQMPSATDSEGLKKVPLELVWTNHARQMYAYRLHSDMVMSPLSFDENQADAPKSRMQVDVEGTLNMRILDVGDVVTAAFQLSPARVLLNGAESSGLSKLYDQVFVAVFSPFGEVLHYVTPHALGEKEKQSLSGLVASLQVVIPPEENRDDAWTWRSKEIDMAGAYVAQYVGSEHGLIFKEKLEYRELGAKPGGDDALEDANEASKLFQAEVLSSACQIMISTGHCWVAGYEGMDQVRLLADGRVFNESMTELNIRLVPFKPNPLLEIWRMGGGSYEELLQQVVMSGFYAPAPVGEAWEAERLRALREQYRNISVPEMSRRMAEAVKQAESHVDTIAAIHAMRDLLEAYPERAAALPKLLKSDPMPDEVAGRIIHALELAGTSEAQVALGAIMVDAEQQQRQRMQAVIAAGGIQEPTQEMVDALQALRSDEATDPMLYNCSVLALGSLSGTYGRLGQGDEQIALTDELVEMLNDEDSSLQEVALLALGNAGGAPLEVVQPWLTSENEMLRSAACGALGASDAESQAVLSKMVLEDESVQVRSAAFQAVLSGGNTALAASLARDQLPKEDDVLLRCRLVETLGREGSAASIHVLELQLENEEHEDVRRSLRLALGLPEPD